MKNIVLIGFMGTGKTSVGKLLSSQLNLSLIDVDEKIEDEIGMPISQIFQQYGEDYFRELEKDAVGKLAQGSNTIIATGGGAVLNPQNLIRLKENGIIISLFASIETVLERTGRRNNRPLLEVENRAQKVTQLFLERMELYKKADFVIDTSAVSPNEVATQIITFLRQGGHLRGRS